MITTAKASRTQPLSVSVDMEKGAGGPPIDPGYIRVHVRVDVGSRGGSSGGSDAARRRREERCGVGSPGLRASALRRRIPRTSHGIPDVRHRLLRSPDEWLPWLGLLTSYF